MERSQFLDRVAEAAESATLPGPGDLLSQPFLPDLPKVDLTAHFIEAFGRLDGIVHHGAPAEVITKIMADRGVSEYVAWDQDHLPTDGLLEELADHGHHRIETVLPPDPEGRIAHQTGYMEVEVGISAAVAALAESGSVVVASGPGRARMVSVIAAVHVVLVPTDRIFRSLSHWIEEVAPSDLPANLMVISGPSRTGDIELTLTKGVHGPGEIHAVLL